MRLKIILSILASVISLTANAQIVGNTNCGNVDWVHHLYNTNNLRLKIAGYTNAMNYQFNSYNTNGTLVYLNPPKNPYYPNIEGGVPYWDGSFPRVDTNFISGIRYYADARSIAGIRLGNETHLSLEESTGVWQLRIEYLNRAWWDAHPYEEILWVGTNSSGPLGIYTCIGSADWAVNSTTLTVECAPVIDECYLDLTFYPSPYSVTNAIIGENACKPILAGYLQDKNGKMVDRWWENINGTLGMKVRDGDVFGVQWPEECRTSGWGIAAQGYLMMVTNGSLPVALYKISLSVPNSAGFIPHQQVVGLSAPFGGSRNLMTPPYTIAAYPQDTTNGYHGAVWKANIICLACEHPQIANLGCIVSFDDVAFLGSKSMVKPSWVLQQGNPKYLPYGKKYIDPMDVLAHIQNQGYFEPPKNYKLSDEEIALTAAPPFTKGATNGFQYIWWLNGSTNSN